MDTQSIVALVGIAIGLSGSILGGAFWMGRKLSALEAAIAPLVGMSERMTRVETKVEALENNQMAVFERMGEAVH